MRKILTISILLNVVLAALVGYGLSQRSSFVAPALNAEESAQNEGIAAIDSASYRFSVSKELEVNSEEPVRSWRDLESTDFRKYIANLRRIGCPDETVADIIISEVNSLFRARFDALPTAKRREYKYWETGDDWRKWLKPKLDPATEKARFEIESEKRALLGDLLGPAYAAHDFPDKTTLKWSSDPFFVGLPVEKRGRVLEIRLRYQNAMEELRDRRGDFMDAGDFQQLAQWQAEMEHALAGVLTPEQFAEFELRFSDAAEALRRTLRTFAASEAEFRVIFHAQKLTRQLSRETLASGDGVATLKQIEDQLREQLGEDRFNEYKALRLPGR